LSWLASFAKCQKNHEEPVSISMWGGEGALNT
jgi:hypothetical protein